MNMAAQIIVALYSCGHAMAFDVTVCILCHSLMSLFKCNVIYQMFIALAGYMGHIRILLYL